MTIVKQLPRICRADAVTFITTFLIIDIYYIYKYFIYIIDNQTAVIFSKDTNALIRIKDIISFDRKAPEMLFSNIAIYL
jgi:hypothetical protein